MRILIILMLSGTLGVLGCDSSSSDNGTGGSGGMAGSGGSAGTGGTAGTGGSAGTGGTAGTGGAGGGTDPAAAFCTDYGTICTFGGAGHQSQQECEDAYNGYEGEMSSPTQTRQECVEMHLGLAQSMGTEIHCPHATGESPCAATP